MPKRTYSKFVRSHAQDVVSNKRSRLDPASVQSPSDALLDESSSDAVVALSSEALEAASTPSSSPPRIIASPPSPPPSSPSSEYVSPEMTAPQLPQARKPTFGFLKRSKTAPEPLSDASGNTQPTRSRSQPEKKTLKQLTIDLGQALTITCSECGMNYSSAEPGDVAIHRKHHKAWSTALQVPKTIEDLLAETTVWASDAGDEQIVRIARLHPQRLRNWAQKLLGIVEEELGGVGVPVDQLWETVERSNGLGTAVSHDRHAVYIFLNGGRQCTGVLLAERIFAGRPVLSAASEVGDSISDRSAKAITASEESVPATLGISRIWTARAERRKGIAARLLNTAQGYALHLLVLPKNRIAFSQPTESGARLARSWFKKEDGWLVYSDTGSS